MTTYNYEVVWGFKEDYTTEEVVGDGHYIGERGVKVRRDGETVLNVDRKAYRALRREKRGVA